MISILCQTDDMPGGSESECKVTRFTDTDHEYEGKDGFDLSELTAQLEDKIEIPQSQSKKQGRCSS